MRKEEKEKKRNKSEKVKAKRRESGEKSGKKRVRKGVRERGGKEKERIEQRRLELERDLINTIQHNGLVNRGNSNEEVEESEGDPWATNEDVQYYDQEYEAFDEDGEDGDEKYIIDGDDDDDDYVDDEYDDVDPDAECVRYSAPLSVTLVGRSMKLHSRRWKRDEKAVIKTKSNLPHEVDGSVKREKKGRQGRRTSDGSWISIKWDKETLRIVKLSSLH